MVNYAANALAAFLATAAIVQAAPVAEKRQTSGGRRGLCFNDVNAANLFGTFDQHWAYNWASNAGGQLDQGIEYVPMLFNGNNANWDADVETALAAGSTHLLGFNEPDQSAANGGSAMSDAAAAAQTYIQMVTPYSGRARLGAPAVSAGGIQWLQDFATACAGQCKVDFVPLHFYDYDHPDVATQIASLEGWLQSTIPQVRSMFNSPGMEIWVTEFAGTPFTDPSFTQQYFDQALPFMDGNADIARYAYFAAIEGDMVSGGQLNAAGTQYSQ